MEKLPNWFQKILDDLPKNLSLPSMPPVAENEQIIGELDPELKKIVIFIQMIQKSAEQMVSEHTERHRVEKNIKNECCLNLRIKLNLLLSFCKALVIYYHNCLHLKYSDVDNLSLRENWQVVTWEEEKKDEEKTDILPDLIAIELIRELLGRRPGFPMPPNFPPVDPSNLN